MTKNLSDSPENIRKRLEILRLWQEEQQQSLVERQNTQRQLLNLEKWKMYEKFGISKDSTIINDTNSHNSAVDATCALSEDGINFLEVEGDQQSSCLKNANISPTKVNKRPFLRRGEGITNRFRVNPDTFRLHNLPKYKYHNFHKKFIQQNVQKTKNKGPERAGKEKSNKRLSKCNSTVSLQKGGLCLQKSTVESNNESNQSNKTHGVNQYLEEINHDNFNRSVSSASRDNLELIEQTNAVDVSEINSRLIDNNLGDSKEFVSQNVQSDFEEPISWAKVLDPNNPIPVKYFRNTSSFSDSKSRDEFDNISLFELLEKKAEEGSFSFNFTSIKQWIASRVNVALDKDDDENDSIPNKQMKTISPIPFDIDNKIILDVSDDETNENDADNDDPKPEKGHVRFSEEVQINEVESDVESVLSNEIESMNLSKTSTPNERNLFEKFKAALFEDNDSINKNESTLINETISLEEKKQEIVGKSELLKTRLNELEGEILSFKQHNMELTKLKQEHELEKIQWQQEKMEIEEKLNDEKIRIEIYLHDERMKIEEEKKKVEKMLRDQKLPNRKEKEEITKLREQVENLQQENKNKESRHVAAQSRLRAQIRVLEKEIKDLNFEREHLKKEIKKLESENARLNRMNNNKVLQEINKTISKLAPKIEATEVKNKSTKPVVAKVVSYQKKRNTSKCKSVPDLSREEIDSSCEESDDTSSDTSKSALEHSKYFSKNTGSDNITTRRRSKSGDRCQDKHKNETISSSGNCKNNLRREIVNTDGSKDIWYPNGNLKKISADGMTIRMLYYNKDIKETNISEGTVKYYYAETNTWHTTYLDGLEILEFPNGQTEHRYKDGTIEVHFPNGSIRISNPTDEHKSEEWRYPDGTTLVQMKNGDKILSLPNGQKEIHTKIHKRREYPDGTVKIVYPDGSQETRYSNGRVRLKDKDGNLVMDSENSNY